MSVDLLQPGQDAEWDVYVHGSARATFCHLSAWKRAIEGAYGLRSFYLLKRAGNEITGILPLFLVRSPILGKALVSVPFHGYGGVCADDDRVARELVDAAKEVTARRRVQYLELRHFDAPHLDLTVTDRYVTYLVDLCGDPDDLWRCLRSEIRNRVRKAIKSGLACRVGNAYLGDFYRVYAEHMRDLGTPVHSLGLFQRMMDEYSDQMTVFVIQGWGRTIGGMVTLRYRDTLNNLWTSSLRRYSKYAPNNLLYWNALKFGCEQGLRCFDFGRSTRGTGPAEFKRRWGARVWPLHYYRWASEGQESFGPVASDYGDKSFVRMWKRLPVPLTKVIGPWVRKGLP